MPAREHHGGILLCCLFLADRAHEDGVVHHGLWEWRFESQLVLRGPLSLLLLHAEQRTELASEGGGDVFKGRVDFEDVAVGGPLEVGGVDHGAAELLDFLQMARLEAGKVLLGIGQGAQLSVVVVIRQPILRVSLEEPHELQLAELKLEVATIRLQPGIVDASPFNSRGQIPLLELSEDAALHIRVCLVIPLHFVVAVFVDAGYGMGHGGRRFILLSMFLLFPEKGRGNGELALPQEMHRYGAVDERGVICHCVRLHGEFSLWKCLDLCLSEALLGLRDLLQIVAALRLDFRMRASSTSNGAKGDAVSSSGPAMAAGAWTLVRTSSLSLLTQLWGHAKVEEVELRLE
ncbi:hypothetical protein TOPH_03939 [Tolypocladium ophioglossoides CBS 100239]|uniref:Uncharacterized protein n=1 Tax=Tolypocladium ophioglossoides (strain CBS 100239) TaxID=1163406 RepID=A0A0L0NC25_TOLOC|nr:hypothetical protein TOPH_03939 [Tolypocladium ophioglossoides CBS 100239]